MIQFDATYETDRKRLEMFAQALDKNRSLKQQLAGLLMSPNGGGKSGSGGSGSGMLASDLRQLDVMNLQARMLSTLQANATAGGSGSRGMSGTGSLHSSAKRAEQASNADHFLAQQALNQMQEAPAGSPRWTSSSAPASFDEPYANYAKNLGLADAPNTKNMHMQQEYANYANGAPGNKNMHEHVHRWNAS